MIALVLALVLGGQTAHPCDAPAAGQTVGANAALHLVVCHPTIERVDGADVRLDGSSLAMSFSAFDIGVSSVSGLRGWRVNLPFTVQAGSHTAHIKSWNYTLPGDQTSARQYSSEVLITFTAVDAPPPQPPAIVAVPTMAKPGEPMFISWTCSSGCGAKDWIGLFLKGSGGEMWWPGSYTNAATAGTLTRVAPIVDGDYEYRYCLNDGYTCPAVAPFSVKSETVPPPFPVDCVVSEWSAFSEWSAWVPISSTHEQRTRTRTRTIVTQPANGGAVCPPLSDTETETREIATPPPPDSCVVTPFEVKNVAWPSGNTGRKSVTFQTAEPWASFLFTWPNTLTVKAARGCETTVKR